MRFRNGQAAARKVYTEFRKKFYWYKSDTAGFNVIQNGMFVVTHAILIYFKDGRLGVYDKKVGIFKFVKDESEALKFVL